MDLEPCSKVHNVVVIQLNSITLGQVTDLKVIFHMMVSILIYKLDKICNSIQFPAPCLNFRI